MKEWAERIIAEGSRGCVCGGLGPFAAEAVRLRAQVERLRAVAECAEEMRADCVAERRCGSYPCGSCAAVLALHPGDLDGGAS